VQEIHNLSFDSLLLILCLQRPPKFVLKKSEVDDLHENGIRLYFGLLALDIIYIFPLLFLLAYQYTRERTASL
jgi:hypothetical protein